MATPCIKEKELEEIRRNHSETRELIIGVKTLVESLIKYQMEENSKKLAEHEARLTKVEGLVTKIIAWSAVGGTVGGFIFNLVKDRL